MNNRELGIALLVLRLGAGVFLLLFGVDKLVAPVMAFEVFQRFYGLSVSGALVQAAGALEILLAVAILAGLWKTLSYGLGLALHAVSTLVTYRELLVPFGENHLFLAAIPALAAFIALFLLRRHDTFWNVSRAPGTGDG